MNKVKQLNNYGIMSGGYIFDTMDKLGAHLLKEHPFDEYKYFLTASAKIKYLRQMLPSYVVELSTHYRRSLVRRNTFYVRIIVFHNGHEAVIAHFVFVGKNKLAIKPKRTRK